MSRHLVAFNEEFMLAKKRRITRHLVGFLLLLSNTCLAVKVAPLALLHSLALPVTAAFIPPYDPNMQNYISSPFEEFEQASEISKAANSSPLFIKKLMYQEALNKFSSNNPDFAKQVALNTADLDQGDFLYKLKLEFDEPPYYKYQVHLPLDGENNGLSSAKEAAAAHDGLWKDVLAVRSIIYEPAYHKIKGILAAKIKRMQRIPFVGKEQLAFVDKEQLTFQKPKIRLAFIGSGWGGDMFNFLEWLSDKDPDLIEYLEIDAFDLSRPFIDKGARELHRRQEKIGLSSAEPYTKVTRLVNQQLEEIDEFSQDVTSINYSELGYTHPSLPIRKMLYKDVSNENFLDSLKRQGIANESYKRYDGAFSMFTKHEMPPSAIYNTTNNFSKISKYLFFIDMDFERKIEQMESEIGSFMLGKIFEATEPFARFLTPENVKELFSMFGTIHPVEIPEDCEATVQASILEFKNSLTNEIP